MPKPNWGMISDGGIFESLVHAILFAKDHTTLLFDRPGRDAGQDARTADGTVVYQAKYRANLDMDGAITLALDEFKTIKKYRQKKHANYRYWEKATKWVLVANFKTNPNDHAKWKTQVVSVFGQIGLEADYWSIETLNGELAQHPEIRDVFFEGENYVLVGLYETRLLLENECVGSDSLDKKMVGRDTELNAIKEFVASDKRVLPVIGASGIGKSRLLYESMKTLSQEDWRVLWALPQAMKRSSKWFHLLNGTQKTCLMIDGADFGLIKTLLEQLSTKARENWRIIFTCPTEKTDSLRQLKNNNLLAKPLKLEPLGSAQSKELLAEHLGNTDDPWAHAVFQLTKGVPIWTCIIAELKQKKKLQELPEAVDDIATLYVESCLESISETERNIAKTILRWQSLWGTLVLKYDRQDTAEIVFLEKSYNISTDTTFGILKKLVATGLVKNYGIGKRCYSVQPKIIRLHILSNWLFDYHSEVPRYRVNHEGRELVKQLVAGAVSPLDSVFRSLARQAMVYLDEITTKNFFSPLFAELENGAKTANAKGQKRIAELVENIGMAIPDLALDVIRLLRENIGTEDKSFSPFWGERVYTHDDMLKELPWILFQIAEHVGEPETATRFIGEFQEYVKREVDKSLKFESGKSPRQLLRRILCESRNSSIFAQPACKYALEKMSAPTVGLICECLLNPLREHMDWVESGTLQFIRRVCLQGSLEWYYATVLRTKIYEQLTNNDNATELRHRLWQVLANAHGTLLRAAFGFVTDEKERKPFIKVIKDDLRFCDKILNGNAANITIEEAEQARKLWEYHLRTGRDFMKLAKKCEKAYEKLSVAKWKLHVFFSFDNYDDTGVITSTTRKLKSVSDYQDFFTAAKEYLDIVRNGKNDLADNMKIAALAEVCFKKFNPTATNPTPLVQYVQSVVSKDEPKNENEWAWKFVVYIYQLYIKTFKQKKKTSTEKINRLLNEAKCKTQLLFAIYSNAGPDIVGPLTKGEFDIILENKDELGDWNFIWLLGVFVKTDTEEVKTLLQQYFAAANSADLEERSRVLGGFIRSCDMAIRRGNGNKIASSLVELIISTIIEYKLDGRILGLHDLEYLCEHSGYRMPLATFYQLIVSRIELDLQEKPYHDFEAWPDDFELIVFVTFKETEPDELEAFNRLCSIAVGDNRSLIVLYSLRKYIRHFDEIGQYVTEFVKSKLKIVPPPSYHETRCFAKLAAIYPENSDAWIACASLICEAAQNFGSGDRYEIYYSLGNDSSGAIVSGWGEVADHYFRKRDEAKKMLETEKNPPLLPYRKWAFERAEAELREEMERVEEVNHE